jgi:hypothetical protein
MATVLPINGLESGELASALAIQKATERTAHFLGENCKFFMVTDTAVRKLCPPICQLLGRPCLHTTGYSRYMTKYVGPFATSCKGLTLLEQIRLIWQSHFTIVKVLFLAVCNSAITFWKHIIQSLFRTDT